MSYRSTSSGYPPDAARPSSGWAYEYGDAPATQPGYRHPPVPPAQHERHHQAHAQRHAQGQPPRNPQSKGRRAAPSGDYTLVHGRRQVRLGPVAFWIVVGSLVVMAGWSILTGTYFAFHDDVLKRLIARQAEMQYAYEDRIAELRAQVDRITSRQMLDQEQFEQKLEQIVRKQSVLEQRASTLGTLPDMTPTGSIPKSNRSESGRNPKPAPINDTVIFQAPADREARLESRVTPALNLRSAARSRGGVEGTLWRIRDSLERMESQQLSALTALEETLDSRARRLRSVLADLGVNPGKPLPTPAPLTTGGIGGPFVPAGAGMDQKIFERHLSRINTSRLHVDKLTRAVSELPVRKPVQGDIDMSSGFGMRVDPFLRSPALHTGLDMRGDTGDPVRAPANGRVTVAGNNGGYGKMVELNHGNGITTRYAHLHTIEVKVGDRVRIGQLIGRIGSTGRSTGPHLHYETRVNGEPVDPQRYLRAGIRLGLH